MFSKKIYKYLIGAFLLSFTVSCTDRVGDNEFNKINDGSSSSKAASSETAESLLLGVMPRIHDAKVHQYQYQFNLTIDNYAGYLVVANSLQGRLPRTYSLNAGFQSGAYWSFLTVAKQTVPVMNSAEELERPDLGAIASIIFNFSASECVDVYGPMPYKAIRLLQNEPPVKYDKVKDIYLDIIADLKKQQDILKGLKPLKPEWQAALAKYDLICGGNVDNWIKFANSLRMRMAMRMVNVEPELAKQEFLSAYNDGALEKSDNDIQFNLAGGRNPLYTISEDWYDTRLNANFENLLTRLNHPALKYWFTTIPNGFKNNVGVVTVTEDGTFAGMRAGMATMEKENPEFTKSYNVFSKVHSNYVSHPIFILKSSEVQFLLAEASLRGWISSSAKTFYYDGIRLSFEREGLSGYVDYVKQKSSECPRIDYVDYYNSKYNSPKEENGSETLGVSWESGLSKEKLLEMIITQKYIANYPLSLESWSEFRRTGYPVMIVNDSEDVGDGSIPPKGWKAPDGTIQPDLFIHRIPFHKQTPVVISDIINSALPALKEEDTSMFAGQDLQATHIWWDIANRDANIK